LREHASGGRLVAPIVIGRRAAYFSDSAIHRRCSIDTLEVILLQQSEMFPKVRKTKPDLRLIGDQLRARKKQLQE
jgi:hypothetical protein